MGVAHPGLLLSGGAPGTAAYVFGAFSAATPPIPVTSGCFIYLNPLSAMAFINAGASPLGPVSLGTTGVGTLPFLVPWLPALAGVDLYLQGMLAVSSPPGFALTQGVRLTLGF